MSDEQSSLTTTDQPASETQPPAPSAPPGLTGKRANWTIAHKVEGAKITWSIKDAGVLVLDTEKVAEANRQRAMCHGFVQRVSDAAAMARDSKTGASATPQQKFEAMKRLVEHYASGNGDWSPTRSVEGVGRPRVDKDKELLAMALGIHSKDKDAQVIAQFVQKLTKVQVTALLMSEQLKESVELAREEIAKEEAQQVHLQGVSAEELLKGL